MIHPEFTVVVTSYYEEKSIDEFHSRLSAALNKTGRSFEIVMINDGSTDRTLDKLNSIFDRDSSVSCVIDFFRNFGQAAAMTAGIAAAHGRHFIFMDSDLQLDPEQLPLLLAEFDAGNDSVSGYRENRNDPWMRRALSKVASIMLRRAAQKPVRDFGCTFRIVHGNLIRSLGYGPYKTFNQAEILAKVGKWKEVPVHHHARKHGKSGWTFSKLFDFYVENLLNVTSRPFQAIAFAVLFLAGVIVFRVALGVWVDFSILPKASNGLVLNVLVLSLLITLAVLSLMGEFVIRGFRTLQSTPKYIIRTERARANASEQLSRVS